MPKSSVRRWREYAALFYGVAVLLAVAGWALYAIVPPFTAYVTRIEREASVIRTYDFERHLRHATILEKRVCFQFIEDRTYTPCVNLRAGGALDFRTGDVITVAYARVHPDWAYICTTSCGDIRNLRFEYFIGLILIGVYVVLIATIVRHRKPQRHSRKERHSARKTL